LVTQSSALYHVLRQYKSNSPIAGRQARRLTTLFADFFDRHLPCIAPGRIDIVAVVPSSIEMRSPPHPLTAVLADIGLCARVLTCLERGGVPASHRHASRGSFSVTEQVEGARVLLVDDVCTTGAHIQSAAWALRAAGAIGISAVVAGRFVRDDCSSSRRLLEQAYRREWDLDACVRCTGRQPAADSTSRSVPAQ
jgi:phosphoribosylpyrophosphate synthetase